MRNAPRRKASDESGSLTTDIFVRMKICERKTTVSLRGERGDARLINTPLRQEVERVRMGKQRADAHRFDEQRTECNRSACDTIASQNELQRATAELHTKASEPESGAARLVGRVGLRQEVGAEEQQDDSRARGCKNARV